MDNAEVATDDLTRRAAVAGVAVAAAAAAAAPPPAIAQTGRATAAGPGGGWGVALRPPLAGKAALVTGGARGIGRAVAVALARDGADVAVGDAAADMPGAPYAMASEAELEEARRLVEAEGRRALAVRVDVRDEGSVRACVRRVAAEFGGLDVAVNNVGLSIRPAPVHEIPTEAYDLLMAVNLRGVFLCMKHEIPAMLARGGGSIINVSSNEGMMASPGIMAYSASKHGVIGATRGAAMDCAKLGIRVNAVAPGPVDTPHFRFFQDSEEKRRAFVEAKVPMGRVGKPEEIGPVVAWLASDAAGFVTGAVWSADGGFASA